MALNISFKLLEINVQSAQDLPPVSKMLRTFVVAWINPDHKLSTRINHQGHTNPTWNHKLVFKVDERFLRSESAAITIQIYNVAWLRDLPIGITRLLINHLSPPLMQNNNPAMRSVALRIRRPSGHLQGILNVGINIMNDSIPSTPGNHGLLDDKHAQEQSLLSEDKEKWKYMQKDAKRAKQSSLTLGSKVKPYDDDIKKGMQVCTKLGDLSVLEIQPKTVASNESMLSFMQSLPSEVGANLKKGLVNSTAGDDFRSSIFGKWNESGECIDGLRLKSVEWLMDDQIPLTKEFDDQKIRQKRKRPSDGRGLFACFGRVFEFTFIRGSNRMKKNRNKMHHHHQKFHFAPPDDDIHRFYW